MEMPNRCQLDTKWRSCVCKNGKLQQEIATNSRSYGKSDIRPPMSTVSRWTKTVFFLKAQHVLSVSCLNLLLQVSMDATTELRTAGKLQRQQIGVLLLKEVTADAPLFAVLDSSARCAHIDHRSSGMGLEIAQICVVHFAGHLQPPGQGKASVIDMLTQ